jgi:transposase
MGYIEGVDRGQQVMFPATLDEYVAENNEVRAIAAFIGLLSFGELGFVRSEPEAVGRPGYDPAVLLGIFIWGHLNRIRSSRRLERECGRNVELMWLTRMLRPDFKTLCRFRQENAEAIAKVLVEFRLICERAELFGKKLVAIDGSKFKAVNSMSRTVTQKKLAAMIEAERRAVSEYLAKLEEADNDVSDESPDLTAEELKQKITRMEEISREHQEQLAGMKAGGETQRSLTDADARLMKTRKGSDVCYNIQTALDSKHKLIVDVEVTNEIADQTLLPRMAIMAKKALGVKKLTVVADGGYFSNDALMTCQNERITPYVPIVEREDAKQKGLFSRKLFIYDKTRDVYVCPQNADLKPTSKGVKKNKRSSWEYIEYSTKQCGTCPVRAQCTTRKTGRKITRWKDHVLLDRLQKRLRRKPDVLPKRKALVEHPFGTIKVAMNHERLLMKGIKNVTTEMKLTVIGYNFKRVLSILGIEKLLEILRSQNIRQNAPKFDLSPRYNPIISIFTFADA